MDEKRILKFIGHYWLALVLLATFILRLPSLFEPLSYGDEAIYLSVGMGIRKGLLLYRDIFDNKPPMIYLLAAMAGNLFWFRFILTAFCLTAIVVMSKLIKIFFPKDQLAQKLGTIFFALITTLPLVEGNIANAEIFQILPITTAVYLILSSKERKERWFAAGLLSAFAILLKIPAVFEVAAVLIFIILFASEKKRFTFQPIQVFFLAGVFLPILSVSLYFVIQHQLKLFLQTAFWQNLGYLSSWKTGSHTFSLANLFKTDFFIKGIFTVAVTLTLWWQKSKFKQFPVLIVIWFLFSLFGATLSERPYPHYLIQVIPSFTLIISYLFVKKPKLGFIIPITFVLLLAGAYFRYHIWRYPVLSYYQNFLDYSLGKKDKNAYFSHFNSQLPQIYKIAELAITSTTENERIFVWGDDGFIYVLSHRLPATPYVAAYHIIDFNHYAEVAEILENRPPALIIVNRRTKPFPQLTPILARQYFQADTDSDYFIYLKRGLN